MPVINTDDLLFPSIVTIMSCYQLATFAQRVGEQRRKHKVVPPAIDGPAEFVRAFRAQQNSIEYFPMYLACLWISSIYFHPVPSSLVGLGYMQARGAYMSEYTRDADSRIPPFKRSVTCLKAFLAMSAMGVTQVGLKHYAGIDLKDVLGLDKVVKMIKF